MCSTCNSGSSDDFISSKLAGDKLFDGLSEANLDAIKSVMRSEHFGEGSLIFQEGETPRGVFMLNEGKVKLAFRSGKRKTRVVRIAEAGDFLGLSATIAGEVYEVSAETITPCRTAFITRNEFLSLLRDQPEFCFRVAQLLGQYIHESYENFRLLGRGRSAAARLVRLIFG